MLAKRVAEVDASGIRKVFDMGERGIEIRKLPLNSVTFLIANKLIKKRDGTVFVSLKGISFINHITKKQLPEYVDLMVKAHELANGVSVSYDKLEELYDNQMDFEEGIGLNRESMSVEEFSDVIFKQKYFFRIFLMFLNVFHFFQLIKEFFH